MPKVFLVRKYSYRHFKPTTEDDVDDCPFDDKDACCYGYHQQPHVARQQHHQWADRKYRYSSYGR